MPKKLTLDEIAANLSKRPTISVIDYNNGKVKYLYIVGAEGERWRMSSGYTNAKDANAYARKLENDLDPEVRKKAADSITTRVTVEEAFDLYIKTKENAQDPKKVAELGDNPAIGKFRTLKKQILKFLAEWNAQPRDKKRVQPNKTVESIQYLDEITTFWLEGSWRPTWFGGKGTYNSHNKRRDLVIEIGHWAQKNGYMPDSRTGGKKCECVFCKMTPLKKNRETAPPTPPFELWQYNLVLDSTALYEASYRDLNTEQLRITNERLRAFIEVMRQCGPRISDAALFCKEDLHYDHRDKQWIWKYYPLKNAKKRQVQVPVPGYLVKLLRSLPDQAGISPQYFFWSGESKKRNASDPWHRALSRLWTLCPDEAKQVYDKRNKQKLTPTSHMFRNTFCVQCRVNGMSYAQIADAIGDTEEVVRDHYSAYCEDYDRMVSANVAKMQAAAAEAAELSVEELKARSRGAAVAHASTSVQ